MKKPLIDDSLSIEKKLSKLLKITERLGRRSVKHSVAIIPPIPISSCMSGDVNGTVLKYIFTCKGVIDKLGVFLNKSPDQDLTISLVIDNEEVGSSKSYTIDKKKFTVEPNIPICSWDRLSVTIETGDSKIDEVWVGLLWTPGIKESTVQKHLIDKLDEASNDLSR